MATKGDVDLFRANFCTAREGILLYGEAAVAITFGLGLLVGGRLG